MGRLERPTSASQPSCKATWLGLRLRPPPGADEGSRSAAAAVEILGGCPDSRPKISGTAKGQLINASKRHKRQRQADSSEVASLRPILIKVDSKRINLNFLCFFACYRHFLFVQGTEKRGFVLKLYQKYKVIALPKNTKNLHFYSLPGNGYLLPSTNRSAVNKHRKHNRL